MTDIIIIDNNPYIVLEWLDRQAGAAIILDRNGQEDIYNLAWIDLDSLDIPANTRERADRIISQEEYWIFQ